ncbi:uncharacterized protein LOC113350641 [Papaver somniferum]|uniref:uncharacterized protein LOC113350641 n=1 Tax=Papaver somniferum TaxID=3469 RepID=UPI000E6F66FD|nr:uncharacterized protein LOC113350641 [Papaver somniferum]
MDSNTPTKMDSATPKKMDSTTPRKMDSSISKKKKRVFSRRAWNFLRFALLWARKGGVLKRGLMMELRVLPNYLKNLKHSHNHHNQDLIRYGERELSFDETPLFQFKSRHSSMKFHLPCIKPQVDFDYDFTGDDDIVVYKQDSRKSFLRNGEEEELYDSDSEIGSDNNGFSSVNVVQNEEEGIDLKAEEFISKFYAQMKLQRQISYLQYTETITKSTV